MIPMSTPNTSEEKPADPYLTELHQSLEPLAVMVEEGKQFLAVVKQRDEARAEIHRLKDDINKSNRMLRDKGYGQGEIDAYVSQCEELDRLKGMLSEGRGYMRHKDDCRWRTGMNDFPHCSCGLDDLLSLIGGEEGHGASQENPPQK